jgi:hypothetical protein
MTKRKYIFPVKELKKTGLPRDEWPLNNGWTAYPVEKKDINISQRTGFQSESKHYPDNNQSINN